MQKRQIRMQDGRYLIFYTFTDELASSGAKVTKDEGAAGDEPEAKPEAEEERRV
jgi:hypothetical protein